jgi:TB2/DP1, HVA22 family
VVEACEATWHATRLWWSIAYPLVMSMLQVIVQLGKVILPWLVLLYSACQRAALRLWPYIRATLDDILTRTLHADPLMLAAILGSLAALLVLRYLYKRLQVSARVRALRRRLARFRARLFSGAKGLPHVLLAAQALVTVVFTPAALDAVSSGPGMTLLSVVLPVFLSFRALIRAANRANASEQSDENRTNQTNAIEQSDDDDEVGNANDMLLGWLAYWVAYWMVVFVEELPFARLAIDYAAQPYWNMARFYYVVWLLVPWTAGAELARDYLVAPLISRYGKRLPSGDGVEQQSSMVLNALVWMRVITAERRDLLVDVTSNTGNVVLLGAIFFVTPSFVTRVGCLLIGIGYPMYASVLASMSAGSVQRHARWLTYWIAYAVFEAGYIAASPIVGWMPFWTHGELLCLLLLQMPYFNFAERIVATFMRLSHTAERNGISSLFEPVRRQISGLLQPPPSSSVDQQSPSSTSSVIAGSVALPRASSSNATAFDSPEQEVPLPSAVDQRTDASEKKLRKSKVE